MGQLVNSAVLTELRSLYPALDIRALTSQQERLVMLLLEGATLTAASRGAGYTRNQSARDFLDTDSAKAILTYFSDRELERISITRDQVNRMYLELYQERGNAMEGARVLEGLARLNGLNEEAKQRKVEINNTTINQQNNVHNLNTMDEATVRKKLETMDASKLLEHASPRFEGFTLNPEDDIAEGELVDADHDAQQPEGRNEILAGGEEADRGDGGVCPSPDDSGSDGSPYVP
ncbi:hypothetical protein [Endozoicomonas ascidiicola]|uniref:hypothetical protein n=1 Tax=Endozoicomonas ascidiicola TaxID=1698521 RepID=UPI000830BC67|nr:hypothetical protein [Endozoicomonas ascidiicola]